MKDKYTVPVLEILLLGNIEIITNSTEELPANLEGGF